MDIIRKLVVEVSNKLSGANPNPKQQICVSAVADALGLQYYPDGKMLQELEGTDLSLTTGKDKNCVNCLAGTNRGVALRVFEYQFVTGCGPTECVHRQTVAWIDLEHDCLPEFQVKNKDFLSDFFGQPANTFDSGDPVFSNEFWTCSTEPRRAKMFFTEEVKAMIRANDWSVESKQGRLLIYRAGQLVDHSKIKNFLSASLKLMVSLEDAQIVPALASFPVKATSKRPAAAACTMQV